MAAILAIAGIVMMTYADGFHSHSVIGIALVVGSASMSALYKVGTVNPPSQQALGQQSSGTHSLLLQTFRMVCRLLRRAYFFSMHREADSTRAGSSQLRRLELWTHLCLCLMGHGDWIMYMALSYNSLAVRSRGTEYYESMTVQTLLVK